MGPVVLLPRALLHTALILKPEFLISDFLFFFKKLVNLN